MESCALRVRTPCMLLLGLSVGLLVPFVPIVELIGPKWQSGSCANRTTSTHPYDFRSRPIYSSQTEHDYRVSWHNIYKSSKTSTGNHAAPWAMRVREEVTIIVERLSGAMNYTLPTCPDGEIVVEKMHALLEGPAIVAPTSFTEVDGTRSAFNITAYDPGIYNLHVESISGCSISNNNTIHPVRGSPFSVVVQGRESFPRRRCSDYNFKHGRWIECHNTPLPCTRTGWVWVPSDCYSHVYSHDEIVTQRPTWVVFAGTSVERGSFFSLVDHLLGQRAANLTDSDFWKCWGWMDLKIGNFRASYLDFRPLADLTSLSEYPNANIEADYTKHAMHTLLNIGQMNGTGPDIFHLELPSTHFHRNAGEYTRAIRSWLGADWRGQFVVSVGKLPAYRYAGDTWRYWYKMPGLFGWLSKHPHLQVAIADETSLAAATIHESMKIANAETLSPGMWSSHYHRKCNESGMHVCSPVCDNTAQQILNMAFRDSKVPKRMSSHVRKDGQTCGQHTTHAQAAGSLAFEFCLRCPKSLVPFTIATPDAPGTVCRNYVPISQER